MYGERFYRNGIDDCRFRSVRAVVGESDLWIGYSENTGKFDAECRAEAERVLTAARASIMDWAADHPDFLTSLEPVADDPEAPPIVRRMLLAGKAADVGPMAAVAGAIAEEVGRVLMNVFSFQEIVIENGGDLWISVEKPITISIYAGLSSLSEKIGIIVPPELCPCGVATSSGTVGPSLSFGKADAALAVASDAAVADAWATALGNRCKNWAGAEDAVSSLVGPGHPELRGALVIMADKLAAAGAIRLQPVGLRIFVGRR